MGVLVGPRVTVVGLPEMVTSVVKVGVADVSHEETPTGCVKVAGVPSVNKKPSIAPEEGGGKGAAVGA